MHVPDCPVGPRADARAPPPHSAPLLPTQDPAWSNRVLLHHCDDPPSLPRPLIDCATPAPATSAREHLVPAPSVGPRHSRRMGPRWLCKTPYVVAECAFARGGRRAATPRTPNLPRKAVKTVIRQFHIQLFLLVRRPTIYREMVAQTGLPKLSNDRDNNSPVRSAHPSCAAMCPRRTSHSLTRPVASQRTPCSQG